MKSKLTALVVAVLGLVAAYAWAAVPLQYTDNGALNLMRPCSYRDKTPTNITVTGASAATAVLTTGKLVRMVCDTDVHYRVTSTAAPTAVTTDQLLPARTMEWWVSEGDYVAAIRDTASGTCYLTVCR